MAFQQIEFGSTVTVKDEVTIVSPGADDTTHKVTGAKFNQSKTLKSTSTPAVNNAAQMAPALTAGAYTIDLTALTLNGNAVNGSTKKVILLKLKNIGEADMTFEAGASNGIDLFGAGWALTLKPGQSFLFYDEDGTGPTIASGDRTIDVTGTGTDSFQLSVGLS